MLAGPLEERSSTESLSGSNVCFWDFVWRGVPISGHCRLVLKQTSLKNENQKENSRSANQGDFAFNDGKRAPFKLTAKGNSRSHLKHVQPIKLHGEESQKKMGAPLNIFWCGFPSWMVSKGPIQKERPGRLAVWIVGLALGELARGPKPNQPRGYLNLQFGTHEKYLCVYIHLYIWYPPPQGPTCLKNSLVFAVYSTLFGLWGEQ